MSEFWTGLLALVLAAPAALGPAAVKREPKPAPVLQRLPEPSETRCAPCHTVKAWTDVKFNHERTGFPLKGAHVTTKCKNCHSRDFVVKVTDTCSGCHRDAHADEFGLRCEGCHDERSWKTTFTADAHRRTNFPLTGGHALIPCTECHGKVRDRNFSRAPIDCVQCHQADYQRTAMTSLDHVAAGFSTDCRQCHDTWRFSPARFAAHDACFRISSGEHRGIRCLTCHTSSSGFQVTGACATGTAACSSCHEHACAKSDAQHRDVAGYQCSDQKCYQCHRNALTIRPGGK